MEENKIIISKYEYDSLRQTKFRYETLVNYILHGDSTNLSFDKQDLSISASSVIKAVKAIDPIWYNEVLQNIKMMKKIKGEE